jgi:ribosome production factor 2
MKQPKQNIAKKVKNQSTNVFGETIGRLHLEKQNLDQIRGKRSKALRLASKLEAEEERAALEDELKREQNDMELEQAQGF